MIRTQYILDLTTLPSQSAGLFVLPGISKQIITFLIINKNVKWITLSNKKPIKELYQKLFELNWLKLSFPNKVLSYTVQ